LSLTREHYRIIDILRRHGEMNITRISRLSGLGYRTTLKKLEELVELGLVEERRFGRLRLFRLKGRLLGENVRHY